jgi:hypothetical protein
MLHCKVGRTQILYDILITGTKQEGRIAGIVMERKKWRKMSSSLFFNPIVYMGGKTSVPTGPGLENIWPALISPKEPGQRSPNHGIYLNEDQCAKDPTVE